MRRDKSTVGEHNFTVALTSTLFGTAVGAAVSAVCLVLLAFLFVSVKSIPQSMIQWFAMFCAGIGALVSGYVATRMCGEKGLVYGTLSSLVLFLMVTLIAFIISRDKFTYITLIRLLFMLFSGAVGGVFAANRKKRK